MTSGYDAVFGRARCYVHGAWSTPSGDPYVPFGGTKLSGYGRELGALGLAEMTEVTAVMS